MADSSTALIDSLIVLRNNALATGTHANIISVQVNDANGNPIEGIDVSFTATVGTLSASSVKTGKRGFALVELKSIQPGSSSVKAKLHEAERIIDCNFVNIGIASITIEEDNAVADGVALNNVLVRVMGDNGEAVASQVVSFSVSNGEIHGNEEVLTDDNGYAQVSFSSMVAGPSIVMAVVGDVVRRTVTNFIADLATAKLLVTNVTVEVTDQKANGSSANEVHAKVTDANDNPVRNVSVKFDVDNSGRFPDGSLSYEAMTGNDGIAIAKITNTKAGVSRVTATFNEESHAVDTKFISDFSGVTATVMYESGQRYSDVAIPGLNPDGNDATTPIVGSVWRIDLTCSEAVLLDDCKLERFDYDWKLLIDGKEEDVSGTNGGQTYTILNTDQGGGLFVKMTPK